MIHIYLKGRLQHAFGCALMSDDLLEIDSTFCYAFLYFWCVSSSNVVRFKL